MQVNGILGERSLNRVVTVPTRGGKRTVIYGIHNQVMNPDQLPIIIDGLFLEGITDYINYPQASIDGAAGRDTQGFPQYRDIFTRLEKERPATPVYLPDLYFTGRVENLILPVELILIPYGEAIAGLSLLQQSFKLGRRGFIRGALGFASAWMLSAGAQAFFPFLEDDRIPTQVYSTVHPEVGLVMRHLRETVVAHKGIWLAENKGGNPEYTDIWGSAHVEYEKKLQVPDSSRLNFLRFWKPLINQICIPETIYQLPEFKFTGQRWELHKTYEIPELKELVAA